MKKVAKSQSFQYAEGVTKFINDTSNIEVISVTANKQFSGEGYTIFYFEFINTK